jgi:hypothetical protein
MSVALLSLRVAAHLLLPKTPPLFATDVRDLLCIFLLSPHIFNVGTRYRRTDTRQTDDSLIISVLDIGLSRYFFAFSPCFKMVL